MIKYFVDVSYISTKYYVHLPYPLTRYFLGKFNFKTNLVDDFFGR